MLKCWKVSKYSIEDLSKNYPGDFDQRMHLLNEGCYLYTTFKVEDYKMLMKEAENAFLYPYIFDISKVSIGSTKICPWCHSKKVRVDDWTGHMQKFHQIIDSSESLRRTFAGFKCQARLYKILTHRLKRNWKQLAVLEGGCYQCLNTNIMFDGTENKVPKRCVRMDTPKSRMVDFSFWEIDGFKLKKELIEGFNPKDYLLGGIIEWKLQKH